MAGQSEEASVDEKWSAVPSPCVRNCCLDDADVCLGCFRSLKEIMEWGSAGDPRRLAILHDALRRRAASQGSLG